MKKKKKKKENKYIYKIIISIIVSVLLFYNLLSINKPYDALKKLTTLIVINDNKKISDDVINSEIEELNKEINNLKELSDVGNLLTDKTYINASIIKRSPNYWYNYITINKGTENGVKKGYAVMSNTGLVGEVAIANDKSSEVILISSIKDNFISAKFTYNEKEYFGLIKDYDIKTNELILEDVIGDINDVKDIFVVTSGLSGNMPSGLLIGKIKDVKKDKYNLSNKIIVEPSGDLNNINFVRVIKND